MKRRIPVWLGVAWALAATAAGAQEGRVYDQLSGAAVPMAQLMWRIDGPAGDPVGRIEADARGRFVVAESWRGEGWIEVRSLGHRPLSLTRTEAAALGWSFGLEPDPLELESVLVTAAGRAQRRSEIAVPIAEITAAEIQAVSAPSVEALLTRMPGLQSTGGTPTVSMAPSAPAEG